MGLFKGMRDLKDLHDMSKEYERPSMSEGLAMARDTLASVQRDQRLLAEGVAGTARILGVRDTGGSLNHHPIAALDLEVTVPGHETFRATLTQPVPRMQAPMLAPGAVVAVRVDPQDTAQVAIDWQGQAAQGMAAAQGAMAGQAMAAAAAGGATAAQDPVARLERLAALHEKGLLTDAELQAQKAKILGEL
jgi:hypothetical protein